MVINFISCYDCFAASSKKVLEISYKNLNIIEYNGEMVLQGEQQVKSLILVARQKKKKEKQDYRRTSASW
jgi:hypothetical protein